MISVVIRNRNQATDLEFLLKNLSARYKDDIDEIVVIDNLSTDNSREIALKYKVRLVIIEDFSYSRSANLAVESAKNKIVVIFSAHSYPVSVDFFKLVKEKFNANQNLAGLRFLHNSNDYENFINGISASMDPNKSGLIFSGSTINKDVWENFKFRENLISSEDKDWTIRVLQAGYEVDFCASVFHYSKKRTAKEAYFRFKNETIASYQLWHKDFSLGHVCISFIREILSSVKKLLLEIFYAIKRFFFLLRFLSKKPERL